MKVKFTGEGGYPFERVSAMEVLVIGNEYEVSCLEVGKFSSSVLLKGYSQSYNICLFADNDEVNAAIKDGTCDDTYALVRKKEYF